MTLLSGASGVQEGFGLAGTLTLGRRSVQKAPVWAWALLLLLVHVPSGHPPESEFEAADGLTLGCSSLCCSCDSLLQESVPVGDAPLVLEVP